MGRSFGVAHAITRARGRIGPWPLDVRAHPPYPHHVPATSFRPRATMTFPAKNSPIPPAVPPSGRLDPPLPHLGRGRRWRMWLVGRPLSNAAADEQAIG